MRIGIDCRLAGSAHAGIGRYVMELVRHVCTDQSVEWVLFVSDRAQQDEIGLSNLSQVTFVTASYRHYSLSEQILLPRVFRQQQLDLLHVPHFNLPLLYRGRVVVTIHDLLWHQQRGASVTTLSPVVYWLKYSFYQLVVKNAVNRASKILVPSETIAKQLVKYYPKLKIQPSVVYEGNSLEANQSETVKKLQFEKYLLYVGSLYPHKNWRLILDVLEIDKSLNLVVVSARSAFTKQLYHEIESRKLSGRVQVFLNLADSKLNWLYQHAQALIQPSFSEGFGLTGIEAMSVGTSVLASDIEVFHEIYADAALYFDPKQALDLHKQIKNNQDNPVSKNVLLKQAKQYSWEKFAKQVMQIYRSCLA